METFNKFNQLVEDLAKTGHKLDTDTIKIAFSNVAPVATNAVFADITEIAAANGYSAGGSTAAFVSGSQTSGTYKLILSNVVFTASGGSIATFRYVVLYNSTPGSPLKPLIGRHGYGRCVSIAQ